jgi:hypothetical protein
MPNPDCNPVAVLHDRQVQQFIQDGFVRIDRAFPTELAAECRSYLWRDTGYDPADPSTWIRPVVRLPYRDEEPFRQAANTARLHAAFDRIVGKGRWRPRTNLGTFPIRFPSPEDPGDTGWHVDKSFAAEDSVPEDYNTWRVNVRSKDRALLMLFLFSDVDERQGPTRIRVGSHFDVARLLKPAGDAGMSRLRLDVTANRPQALATGEAGTVYLCHPFLVHAAQPNRGTSPRFLAQPPLHPAEPLQLFRHDGNYSPVEIAIRRALEEEGT